MSVTRYLSLRNMIALVVVVVGGVAISSVDTESRAAFVRLTANDTRPYAITVTLLLVGGTAWGSVSLARSLRKRVGLAWRASLRFAGWIPFVLTLAITVMALIPESSGTSGFVWEDRTRIIESFIPLAVAIQAALIFSPDDELALEVMLASPRPIYWVLLERLAIVLLGQGAIALVTVALSLVLVKDQEIGVAVLRWLPPMILMAGMASYITLSSRVAAFGVTVSGLVWFFFNFFGESFLPGAPTFWPLNALLPFIWPFHPYLQPADLGMGDYWLNRLCVLLAGIGFIMLAVYQLQQEESVLLGSRQSKSKG
ncbi:MAG: hypothetical protein H6672_09045 [Anaerolineaceae bacterium]|nr:hypothetical protein [Anaerolineaceae bacterium]